MLIVPTASIVAGKMKRQLAREWYEVLSDLIVEGAVIVSGSGNYAQVTNISSPPWCHFALSEACG